VTHLVLSDHAIERCEERGIAIMEVYSTIADPQYTRTRNDDGTNCYLRGDLSVVVDHKRNSIPTVIDRMEDFRTTPRIPLNPLINRGGAVARRSSGLDETWCLLAHTEPDMRLITVTPALAEKLLSFNVSNRPLNKALVSQYKEAIETGVWRVTHQGVALDSNQTLQDGQHRLTAIVETGQAQQMWVAVGMDPANFTAIDVGRNRKFADVLAVEGYTDTHNLGATARLVYIYSFRDFVSTHKVTNAQVIDLVDGDPDGFSRALSMGRAIQGGISMSRTAAGAGYYLIRKVNPTMMVDDFFESLITGENLPTGDIRPRLIRVMANSQRTKLRRTGPEQMALLIKTWNAWAEDRSMETLAWRKSEAMPRVTRVNKEGKPRG
jgi:hypothetical protein